MYNNISMIKGGNKGFTIVETLIVLAIAATIIVVVLLAVPALQRQSRNTATKVGAGAVASGWTAEVGNSNDAAPTTVTGGTGKITINTASYNVSSAIVTKVSTYNSVGTTVAYGPTSVGATGSAGDKISVSTIALYTGATCPATTTGTSLQLGAGTTTQAAIVYSIEPGNVGCLQG